MSNSGQAFAQSSEIARSTNVHQRRSAENANGTAVFSSVIRAPANEGGTSALYSGSLKWPYRGSNSVSLGPNCTRFRLAPSTKHRPSMSYFFIVCVLAVLAPLHTSAVNDLGATSSLWGSLTTRAERALARRAATMSAQRAQMEADATTSSAGALLVAAGTAEGDASFTIQMTSSASSEPPRAASDTSFEQVEDTLTSSFSGGTATSVFEDALAATFTGSVSVAETLAQYSGLLEWLGTSAARASVYGSRIRNAQGRSISPSSYNASSPLSSIPELKNFAVREIMHDAIQVASQPQNETALLSMLEYIQIRLTQRVKRQMGYPITRRIILGALLKRRIEDGPFSPAVHEAVQRILLQLFSLHKGSSAARGAVQFFHISKSGGTNLCQTAQANGCDSEGFDLRANCLVKAFGDTPRWVTFPAHKYIQYTLQVRKPTPWFVNFHTSRRNNYACAARRSLMRQRGWNFYANEYTAAQASGGGKRNAPAQLCGEFVNLLLFRDPVQRLHSQVVWIQKLYRAYYRTVDTSVVFDNKTTSYWQRLAPAAVENYYIRSLLGQRHFEYPMTELKEKDLHNAQLATLQHDLLMTLEHKEATDITLKVGLGWTHTLQDQAIRSSSTFDNHNGTSSEVVSAATIAANSISAPMPVDYDNMLAINQLDVRLYQFAKAMQMLDVLLFRSVAMRNERLGLNNLSTRKCGYVSLAHDEASH